MPAIKIKTKNLIKIKGIIESIRDDELRYNQMCKNMYYQITGMKIWHEEKIFIPPTGFKDGISDGMMRELNDIKVLS